MIGAEERGEHHSKVVRPAGFAGLELTQTHTALPTQTRHFHDEYQIGVIQKGSGIFHYRGERHTVSAGLIAVVQAGEAHSCFTNFPAGWSFGIVYLDPGLFANALSECWHDSTIYFPMLSFCNVPLAKACLELFDTFEQPATQLEQEARLLDVLTNLVNYCSDTSFREPPLGQEHRAVTLTKTYLNDHIGEDVTLSDLVGITGLSKFYLLRQFSSIVGLTPHEYQTSLRIAAAKVKLRQGEPLARVSADIGFADQSHFTRTFKKLVGMTPRQYQRCL